MNAAQPYASKILGERKLFKRVHGQVIECAAGLNTINFVIPYDHAKMTAVEFVGCEALDVCDFKVLDSDEGSLSGHPNAQLNQFGFGVVLPKDFYSHSSHYDVDLYKGLIVQVSIVSMSAKSLGINYVMDEVK